MAKLYMVRTPGTDLKKGFPTCAHLKEGRVYDNVSKDDAEKLTDAGLAEEFDADNEQHAQAVADYKVQDAKKPEVKSAAAPKAAPAPEPEPEHK